MYERQRTLDETAFGSGPQGADKLPKTLRKVASDRGDLPALQVYLLRAIIVGLLAILGLFVYEAVRYPSDSTTPATQSANPGATATVTPSPVNSAQTPPAS